MRRQMIDTGLAQTIAWIWLGFLVAGAIAWFAYRYWRRRHPPPPPPAPERSYSERLEQRLVANSRDATKRKRSGGSAKSPSDRQS